MDEDDRNNDVSLNENNCEDLGSENGTSIARYL